MSLSHPLSTEPPKRRTGTNQTNYFSLKHASDERAKRIPLALLVSPSPELGVKVDSEDPLPTATDVGANTPMQRTPLFEITDGDEDPASQMVLSTRWHTLSDQEIQVATIITNQLYFNRQF